MVQNTLGSLMKKAAEEDGLDGRITNHSIRKTTVTTLSKAGVPLAKIMQVTGHQSIASIPTYDNKLSFEEQRQYNNILTGSSAAMTACSSKAMTSTQAESAYTAATASVDTQPQETATSPNMCAMFRGATFNNCTFNLKY